MSKFLLLVLFISPALLSNTEEAEKFKFFKKEGYIITNDGDKIEGEVLLRRDKTYDEVRIKFIGADGEKKLYKAVDIKEYGFRDIEDDEYGNRVWQWKHYVSQSVDLAPIPFGPKTVFMEKVAEGDVVLYEYWVQANKNIDNPYIRMFYLQRGEEFLKVTEDNFEEVTKSFFSDNEEIASKMGEVNHRFRHLEKIVGRYNAWKARVNNG